MNQNGSKNLLDWFLLGASAIGFLGSLYLLFDDHLLEQRINTDQLTQIGQINNMANDVRRKNTNSFSWAKAKSKDAVFEGDSIFTGDDSQAKIELKAGGSLDIESKSLVVVRTSENGLKLDLAYGGFSGKLSGDQKLVLVDQGGEQEISSTNAEIQISHEKGTAAQIKVKSGEIQVGGSGGKQTIKTNETVELNGDKASTKIYPIEPVSPAPNAMVWVSKAETLTLVWKSAQPDPQFEVELAKDIGFNQIIAKQSTNATSFAVEPALASGPIFWRVSSQSNGVANKSRARKVIVFPNSAPEPLFPTEAANVTIDSQDPVKNIVNFSWKDSAGSSDYVIQIGRDSEMQNILTETKTKSASLEIKSLSSGTFYWRVQGRNEKRANSPFSSVVKFQVTDRGVPLTAPVGLTQATRYVIPFDVAEIKDAGSTAPPAEGLPAPKWPELKWNPVTNTSGYIVETADNSAFKNSMKNKLTAPTFVAAKAKPGTFFWRVIPFGRYDNQGPISAPEQVQVQLPPPRLQAVAAVALTVKSPAEYEKLTQAFSLKWSALYYADAYELQLSNKRDAADLHPSFVQANSKELKLAKPGVYFWKVRAVKSDHTPLSAFSEISSFKFEKATALPIAKKEEPPPPPPPRVPASIDGYAVNQAWKPPAPNKPEDGAKLVTLGQAFLFLPLEWVVVPEVKQYEIQISAQKNFAKILNKYNSTKASFLVKNPNFPPGKIYWRVRGIKEKESTPWSEVRSFNIE